MIVRSVFVSVQLGLVFTILHYCQMVYDVFSCVLLCCLTSLHCCLMLVHCIDTILQGVLRIWHSLSCDFVFFWFCIVIVIVWFPTSVHFSFGCTIFVIFSLAFHNMFNGFP